MAKETMTGLLLALNSGHFISYQEKTLNDKDWIVVNGVAIVEGVLNDRYVSKDEFAKFEEDWNGVPLVMRHPKENNGSARVPAPDVPVIGKFYNARLDGDRLVGDFWIEKNELLKTPEGELVYANIKAGRPTEVSTAYYSTTENKKGEYKDKPYHYVDTDLHPDHIAILPDEVGACSVKDGCGLARNIQAVTANCGCSHENAETVIPSVSPEISALAEAFVLFVNS